MRVTECALALYLVSGCAQVDVVAVRESVTKTDAGQHDAAPNTSSDAAMTDAHVPQPECDYRAQSIEPGSSLSLQDAFTSVLGRAVCSCEAIAQSARLDTDVVGGKRGADVGANAEMSLETSSHVRGSIAVAGSSGLSLGQGMTLTVAGDLAIGGPFEGGLASAQVGGNTAVAGRISLGALSVGGELVQPAGAERSITGTSQINATRSAAVHVDPPCACSDALRIRAAVLVRDAASTARKADGTNPVLTERCGRYVLANATIDTLHVTAHASAALYVPGDLQLGGGLIVDTDPGAELDVFIEGNARVDGAIELGSDPGQGAVRLFVGGSGTVQLSSGGTLHGVLFAPGDELVLSAPLTVTGAIFVRRVAASADLSVHYDPSLTH